VFDACLPKTGFCSAAVRLQSTRPSAGSRHSTRHCTAAFGSDGRPIVLRSQTPLDEFFGRSLPAETAVVT
jgi:hypothetical protein